MAASTVQSATATAANVTSGFNWPALAAAVLSAMVPVLLQWLQEQKDRPTEVHDAIPDPKTDAAVTDAIGADIAAGLVGAQ